MNSGQWYGIGLGSIFALWILYRVGQRLLSLLLTGASFAFFRYLVLPHDIFGMNTWGDISRFQLLLLLLFLAANVFCVAWGTQNIPQANSRVALLSLANLIPLFAGSRLSLAADALGVSLRTQHRMHRWFGILSALQAGVHSALSVADRSFTDWNEFTISGLVVRSAKTSLLSANGDRPFHRSCRSASCLWRFSRAIFTSSSSAHMSCLH